MAGNVFTLPPGVPFLKALARAILSGDLPTPGGAAPDPLSLPNITLLLPTRRAARVAREAFLAAAGARAIIMPRIQPISEGEGDLSLIAGLAEPNLLSSAALEHPPAISPLARTLTLMQLVGRWRQVMGESFRGEERLVGATPAQAAQLAFELGKLMDDVEREKISLEGIQGLVPGTYSEHWQKTVDFLKIVTEFWPEYLAETGLSSAEARRNALILAEAQRISALKPDEAVIVAGVTGSIPATVALMRAVQTHPSGALVLPALDQSLDDESWDTIVPDHPEHPQFGLKKLLDGLGIARDAVKMLPGAEVDAARTVRAAFFSEAMRPSTTTARWQRFAAEADKASIRDALAAVSLIEAPSAHDEAEVVALILRDAVEVPGRTAALVSPDRLLARRVAIRLEAWGIHVDDSAGRPFAKTVPGAFLALVIGAAVSEFAPAETMALLRHPLCRMGYKSFDIRRYARALEISAFRAPYLGRGIEGIIAALDNAERDRTENGSPHIASRRLWREDCDGARELVMRLGRAFRPLIELNAAEGEQPLASLARAHAAVGEALATLPDDETEPNAQNPLWQREAGEAAARFFAEILDPQMPRITLLPSAYADLYATLLSRENVREQRAVHPRVSIWGPFEARLQQPDILILGSLNEGTWPEAAEPGAWLNRQMRRDLGLPSPEEEIGRAAHDFVSLLGAETVYLTRAEKMDGVPTVPSRWLMRIKALLDGMEIADVLAPNRPWLAWARARDRIDQDKRQITAPEPKPDVGLRPRKLSVTQVETWISNPYAIFARHILGLVPLPALGSSPDQSLRGSLVHDVLAHFAREFPGDLPADPLAELERIAGEVLQGISGNARVAAFWLPRMKRFLSWFAASEKGRREGVRSVITETSGSLVLSPGPRPFTLTARADRIDDKGASIIITDYKTGRVPSDASVKSGRAPQLPLEAAIAFSESGFKNLHGRSVEALRYIRASGGEPPGEERVIKSDDIAALAASAREGLERLIAAFDRPETPYRAIRRPSYSYEYDAYAHLARVAEWSAHVDDETTA